jgi:hypothetical protein
MHDHPPLARIVVHPMLGSSRIGMVHVRPAPQFEHVQTVMMMR